nr:MAG TPA: hypothetical protein [Caudoviricetes sp.]
MIIKPKLYSCVYIYVSKISQILAYNILSTGFFI